MKTQNILQNKYYLTRAQFEARKATGSLEVGAEYYITDDHYSNVSVSATGSATAEVRYIIVDGVEKRLASPVWGEITGFINSQLDLKTALDGKMTSMSIDSTPVSGSTNLISSNAVYNAIVAAINADY